MSGETRGAVSGWTVDTSRENLLALMDERDTRYGQRFAEIIEAQRIAKEAVGTALLAQQAVVQRAEEANDRRFEQSANQRRASDMASGLMMPRIEAEQRYAALEQQTRQQREVFAEQITALRETMAVQITALTTRLDRTDGRSGGFSAGWGYLVAGIIALGVLVGIVMRFVPAA